MPSIKIKNFKYGLDSRRSELESQPGTLVELVNAIVNQGGEIEKRLAFVRTAAPADSFGAQPTSSGIVLFGSAESVTLPVISGVTFVYQRLQHPAVLAGEAYVAGSHAMTEITASECFAGKAFAVAKFADGKYFAYYDGSLVKDFTNGLVLAYMSTNAKIADHFVSIINDTASYTGAIATVSTTNRARTGTTATLTVNTPHGLSAGMKVTITGVGGSGYNLTAATVLSAPTTTTFTYTTAADGDESTADPNGTVTILEEVQVAGPVGVDFTLNVSDTAASGALGTPFVRQEEIASRAGLSATAFFKVMAGSESAGVNKITKVEVVSPAGVAVQINDDAIDYVDDNDTTAAAIAQEINDSGNGYTATSEDNIVTVYSADDASPMPNKYVLQVTVAGNVCIGDCMFYFVQLSPSGFTITNIKVNGLNIVDDQDYPDGATDTFVELYAALETEINADTGTHGIVAKAATDYIQISKQVTRSDDIALPVSVNIYPPDAASAVFGAPPVAPSPLTLVLPSSHYDFAFYSSGFAYGVETITAEPEGGIQPYSYQWEPETDGANEGTGLGGTGVTTSTRTNFTMHPVRVNAKTTLFYVTIPTSGPVGSQAGTYSCRFVCRVTDAAGTVFLSDAITVNITVRA